MSTKTKIFLTLLFFFSFFLAPAVRADVIISEFSIGKYIGGKATSTNGDDFVELYNTGDTCVPLEGWRLRKRIQSGTESPLYSFKKGDAIMPSDFLLWVSSKAKSDYQKLADVMPTISQEYTLSGNNSVALLDTKNTVKDAITFGSGHIQPFSPAALLLNPGDERSIERNFSSLKWSGVDSVPTPTRSSASASNDLDGDGCPDQIIPISPAPTTDSTPSVKTVRLNEIFPNPAEKEEENEFIELYNDSEKSASLIGWSIRKDRSDSGTNVYTIKTQDFPLGTDISAGGFFLIPRKNSGFVMANTNKIISLYSPSGTETSFVQYKTAKEGVSLNYTSTGWRGGTPTPGTANILNNLPETKEKVPKKGYRNIPVTFNAKGKDADGDKLKYTWNFGDGHKSYKAETSHAYEENGTYTVTLTTSDNKEDSIETFSLKIESYKPPEVRITSLVPNPAGKDTDNEWIAIENREKKEVNLKGFGIATGWKKLANHPIREDFILKPKQEAKLTHMQAAFTLPNQKGKIELRSPDGKPLQTIKYKLEKSAAEDVIYSKKKGERWKFEETKIQQDNKTVPEVTEQPTDELSATENMQQEKVLGETIEESSSESPITHASGPVSEELHRPRPADILNYGTNLKLPDNITYTPHDALVPITPLQESSSVSTNENSNLLEKINASLNDFLNK